MTNEQLYTAAWQSLSFIGPSGVRKLVHYFGSAEKAWKAADKEIFNLLHHCTEKQLKISQEKKCFDWDRFLTRINQLNLQIISYQDVNYPPLLSQTYNPPAALFYRGTLSGSIKNAAIVGSRRCTSYGKNAALHIAQNLSAQDITIVSGGARGIDTAAHTGALQAEKPTIAVMACGLHTWYPPENKRLFQDILDRDGAIISEYAPGIEPLPQHFPARNRIISGLARCVIVIEAAKRSGSLITADFALEEGRDIFAVPGSIFSKTSEGTNELLRMGAIPLTKPVDLLNEYGWNCSIPIDSPPDKHSDMSLTLLENTLLQYIPYDEALSQDDLIVRSQIDAGTISRTITTLMIKGLIWEDRTGRYIRFPS